MTSRIDRSKINIVKKGFRFKPFRPTEKQEMPLAQSGLKSDTELLAFERGDQRRTFIAKEMAYHHIGQGTLAGAPYLVTF